MAGGFDALACVVQGAFETLVNGIADLREGKRTGWTLLAWGGLLLAGGTGIGLLALRLGG